MRQNFEGYHLVEILALVFYIINELCILMGAEADIHLDHRRLLAYARAHVIAALKEIALVHIGRVSFEKVKEAALGAFILLHFSRPFFGLVSWGGDLCFAFCVVDLFSTDRRFSIIW